MAKVREKKTRKINSIKEEFKFGVKGGKVREEGKHGRSIGWAERVESKKKELDAEGVWKLLRVWHVSGISHCEFCNHEIVRQFEVQSVVPKDSKEKPKTLKIGSECVKYFTSLDAVIEIILHAIRLRRHQVDCVLKMQKIYKYLIKNEEDLKNKRIDRERYGKVENVTVFDLIRSFIEAKKKPRVTERAMNKADIPVNGDWYKWTKKEEKIRNDVRNIKEVSGNDIVWEIPNFKLPKYPKFDPQDFSIQ